MVSLVKDMKGYEKHALDRYQEPIDVAQNEFIEMLIIAASLVCSSILFDLTLGNDQSSRSLTELVLYFFQICFTSSRFNPISRSSGEKLHILDLIRSFLIPSQDVQSKHKMPERKQLIPSVTHLMGAEVEFTKSSSNNMMDMVFEDGTFKIPTLFINETTESFFRSQIVFEQCSHTCKDMITSYAILMDSLINTRKDVEILSDKGIIENWLIAKDASQYFNRLYNDTYVTSFYYYDLHKKVNSYYRTRWHKWRAILMRNYFTTPWTIISLVAAFILLVLTFLQTFYTIQ
nr:uncharacterized protein LOC112489894 [Ziziphus jujuba var. spinosa]